MSAQDRQRRLPRYAVLDPQDVERYAMSTRLGHYGHIPSEVFWSKRYQYLKDAGYLLRPRYAPNWEPSWIGTNLAPMFCEDSIVALMVGAALARFSCARLAQLSRRRTTR